MAVLKNASEFWLCKSYFMVLIIGKVWTSDFLAKQTYDFLILKNLI